MQRTETQTKAKADAAHLNASTEREIHKSEHPSSHMPHTPAAHCLLTDFTHPHPLDPHTHTRTELRSNTRRSTQTRMPRICLTRAMSFSTHAPHAIRNSTPPKGAYRSGQALLSGVGRVFRTHTRVDANRISLEAQGACEPRTHMRSSSTTATSFARGFRTWVRVDDDRSRLLMQCLPQVPPVPSRPRASLPSLHMRSPTLPSPSGASPGGSGTAICHVSTGHRVAHA
eukprot:1949855-Rhodomonas_salina.14